MNMGKSQNTKIQKENIFSRISKALGDKSEILPVHQMGENQNLIESIRDAKKEWISANYNFEQAVDSEIIDYYIYKIKAYQVRYEYLLKKAKEKGITYL